MTLGYTSRNPIIINYTILAADTWEHVASPVAGVRKWWIKTRENSDDEDVPFDTAFKDNPDTYWTNCGSGFVIDDCDLMNVWCRCAVEGTIIELMYFG